MRSRVFGQCASKSSDNKGKASRNRRWSKHCQSSIATSRPLRSANGIVRSIQFLSLTLVAFQRALARSALKYTPTAGSQPLRRHASRYQQFAVQSGESSERGWRPWIVLRRCTIQGWQASSLDRQPVRQRLRRRRQGCRAEGACRRSRALPIKPHGWCFLTKRRCSRFQLEDCRTRISPHSFPWRNERQSLAQLGAVSGPGGTAQA